MEFLKYYGYARSTTKLRSAAIFIVFVDNWISSRIRWLSSVELRAALQNVCSSRGCYHIQRNFSGNTRLRSEQIKCVVTRIEFQYNDANKRLHSKNWSLRETGVHPEWGNASTWDHGHWRAGSDFTVFVNPSNLDEWALNQGPSRETYAMLGFGALLALISAGLFYPALIQLFSGDPGDCYIPPDDPRSLARDTRYNNTRW